MKKMKYQISVKSFIWIEVNSKEEEIIVKDLNNEFDKYKKRNRTYMKNTVSVDRHKVYFIYEFPDNSPTISEKLITRDEKRELCSAINKLPKRQKETIVEYFYKNKSLRQIAREKHLNDKTVRESYHFALENLRKLMKK